MSNPGKITIAAIGPLTNLATAISLEPRLARNVSEIVVMGGVFQKTMPRRDMPGEFNVWTDPEAAAAVLRCGAPMRWVGLDVTLQVRLTREHAERLRTGPGEFGSFAGACTLAWIDHLRDQNPGSREAVDSCAMHDPLAIAVLTRPDLVTWTEAAVDIVTGDGIARGVMVTDLLQGSEPPTANCRIATAVDVDGFLNHFLAALSSLT